MSASNIPRKVSFQVDCTAFGQFGSNYFAVPSARFKTILMWNSVVSSDSIFTRSSNRPSLFLWKNISKESRIASLGTNSATRNKLSHINCFGYPNVKYNTELITSELFFEVNAVVFWEARNNNRVILCSKYYSRRNISAIIWNRVAIAF